MGRARDQANRAANKAIDEATNRWASRGFTMPGGVIANQIQMIDQEQQYNTAELAGAQAIKALDIQIDVTKFAADVGVRLKTAAMEAVVNLIKLYMELPRAAADFARAQAEAIAAVERVMIEYYRTMLEGANITLRANMANSDEYTKTLSVASSFIVGKMQAEVQGRTASAQVYSQQAAAAMGVLNAVAVEANNTSG